MKNKKEILGFILKKFFKLITLLIALCIVTFILLEKSPLDPVQAYVGADLTVTQEQRENIAEYWGLNKPPLERFSSWFKAIAKGDLGRSMIYRRDVVDVISERFMASLALMLVAWVVSGVLGFILGIVSGINEGKFIDKFIRGYCYVLISTPTFWIGILLIIIFSVKLKLFPTGLGVPIGVLSDEVTISSLIKHLTLPALTLSILGISRVTLFTRQKLIEILNSDFILFAKARGENTRQLVIRHGLRNIALPAITEQFASFSELFGGIALAETVFSYPGLGTATTAAGLNGDVPLLLGIAIFSAIFVFVGNFIANILYGVLDPRLKEGKYNG